MAGARRTPRFPRVRTLFRQGRLRLRLEATTPPPVKPFDRPPRHGRDDRIVARHGRLATSTPINRRCRPNTASASSLVPPRPHRLRNSTPPRLLTRVARDPLVPHLAAQPRAGTTLSLSSGWCASLTAAVLTGEPLPARRRIRSGFHRRRPCQCPVPAPACRRGEWERGVCVSRAVVQYSTRPLAFS